MTNLTFIRTFAAGIVVPKSYIWPVNKDLYLKNHTSRVLDAHKVGLEVFATDFANYDASFPYDYSYDPVAEYLAFIDDDKFSVDGVISDFPLTRSATIDCFSQMTKNEQKQGSINLGDRTNVASWGFMNRTTSNPELNIENGIFAYDLTWSKIQSLKPAIFKPFAGYFLLRNPTARNDGNLMRLSDILAFPNNAFSVSGILIDIENVAYLAEKQELGVTDSVMDALSKAVYNKETSKKIMIKSSDSALLLKFKRNTNHELVYLVNEDISDILNSAISEIKAFANAIVVSKRSVFSFS